MITKPVDHQRRLGARALHVPTGSDAVTVLSDDLRLQRDGEVAWKSAGTRASPSRTSSTRSTSGLRQGRTATARSSGSPERPSLCTPGTSASPSRLDLVLDAAAALMLTTPDLAFVIKRRRCGTPRTRTQRKQRAYRPLRRHAAERDRLPEVPAAADIYVVLLASGLARGQSAVEDAFDPGRGRPIVASVDTGTEVAAVVERANLSRAADDPVVAFYQSPPVWSR